MHIYPGVKYVQGPNTEGPWLNCMFKYDMLQCYQCNPTLRAAKLYGSLIFSITIVLTNQITS